MEEAGKKGGGDGEAVQPKTIEATPAKKGAVQPEAVKEEKPAGTTAAFNPAAGDPTKGRYVFRKCLACHKKNKGPIISPGDRTVAAWDRFLLMITRNSRRQCRNSTPTYGCTTEQMQNLHKFVTQYALDAAKPKTCE